MAFKKYACLVFCMMCLAAGVSAQSDTTLSLRDAIEIALKNNYHILLSKNNSAVAQNNVTVGNAGFLPQVNGDFSTSRSIQNTKQTRSDGTVNNIHGAKNSSTSYGPSLNWTIFDGFAMFANYDELKQLSLLGQLRERDTIQNTIASVIETYYNLININEGLKALQGAINISRTQLKYANDKYQVGRASGLDVLNAQVNLNTDTANYLNQLQQFKQAKVQMNQLLVRPLQTDFAVGDTIVVDHQLMLGDIISKAETQNPAILSAQINKRISEINLKQVKAGRYPQVSLNSGYTVSSSQTPAGFARSQNVNGFSYGLTASINIFNGFNQNRLERNARIGIENADINYKQITLDVQAQISNLYISYLSGLDLIKLGQSNVAAAKRNLDISLEKYRLGNITPLETREAQRNYLDAQSKFFTAQYQSKSAEIMLKEIMGAIDIQ
ncbi:MAG TPA: TolC family protein [Mucilaginibacter sp.]|nr:TolC family protein [Mucilaginibacter sp.]